MKLSILICSLNKRASSLNLLVTEIRKQIDESKRNDIEYLTCSDNGEMSIGSKRNHLVNICTGEYICFVDDDDEIASNYIATVMDGIDGGFDCCSLRGVITWNGENAEVFEHSIRYKAYVTTTNAVKYERYPNHLNVIRKAIAVQFKFPEISHGEDTDWATRIHNSGLIKSEYYTDKILYHYKFIPNK